MVSTRRAVDLTAATPKVRHGIGQALLARPMCEGLRVVALGRTFKTMEQHQQWLMRLRGVRGEVQVNEVRIRACPALSRERGLGQSMALRIQSRPNRLELAAGQPSGGAVIHGLSATSSAHPTALAFHALCRGWHGAPPCASLARSCDTRWWQSRRPPEVLPASSLRSFRSRCARC